MSGPGANAGRIAPALSAPRCLQLGWISRMCDTRALRVTAKAKEGFSETFGIVLND